MMEKNYADRNPFQYPTDPGAFSDCSRTVRAWLWPLFTLLAFHLGTLKGQAQNGTTEFITKWQTSMDNESITIPTIGTGYNYSVDWGDGSEDTGLTGDATHTYATANTYTVSITGVFPRIYFAKDNNGAYNSKLSEVAQWGDNPWTSMEGAFRGCGNLNITATDAPDLSAVSSLKEMFDSAGINQDLSSWNVGNVTDMNNMFSNAQSFNQPLSNWDVGNVTDMGGMFSNANSFNQDISNWNVGNVRDMSNMFSDGFAFNQPLSSWNVAKVTDMSKMFSNAYAFDQPLSGWNVSSVTNMSGMFNGTVSFDQDLSSWNVGNVTDMSRMFSSAFAFDSDLSSWDVSNVADMSFMFGDATSFDQDLGNWDLSSLVNALNMFTSATLSRHNYDALLTGWSTDTSGSLNDNDDDIPSNINFHAGNSQYCAVDERGVLTGVDYGWIITDGGLDPHCGSFITKWRTLGNNSITIPTTGTGYNYSVDWGDGTEDTGLTGDATHTYASAGTYEVSIDGAFPRIYFRKNTVNADKLSEVVQWGDNLWTSMEDAFMGCAALRITAMDAPNLSAVTNMNNMFNGAFSINQDLSSWNVGSVTNMSGMFNSAVSFNQDLSSWNVGSVIIMSGMFARATSFNQALSDWNVGSVTNMSGMFLSATSFNQALSGWNVGSVTDMSGMFNGATSFNQALSGWNVGSVTDMSGMFNGATSFDHALSGWNVGSVTNMSGMFLNATSFNQALSDWNVGNVGNMSSMFRGAVSFDQELGDWDIGSIVDSGFSLGMRNMFVSTGLSAANYDATLIGWSTDTSGVVDDGIDDIPSDINFHAGDSQYCAVDERGILTGTYSWDITDGGETANCNHLIPRITSPATASVEENQTAAIDVNATDDRDSEGSGLSYTLMGIMDDNLFGIEVATGVVTFNTVPDFENPQDANTDNIYNIQVMVTDLAGLTDVQDIAITVTDVDETAPVITLLGDNPIYIALGDTYVEPGATATDDIDGDLSSDIVIGGDTVDTNVLGSYELTYDVSDAAGNAADQKTRVVIVEEACAIAELDANNFQILVSDETCSGKENGSIQIQATAELDYTISIADTDYSFRSQLLVDELAPGTYTFCIGLEGAPDCEQCFEATVAEGTTLEGTTSVVRNGTAKARMSVAMLSGTTPFKVSVNGYHQATYSTPDFTVDVADGDQVEVTSSLPCEGTLSIPVELPGQVSAFPNPVSSELTVTLPSNMGRCTLSVHQMNGAVVFQEEYDASSGNVQISLAGLPSGMYLVKVQGSKEPITLKIIKE
ncbi:BspA family leucine-rich repeat surface protein [Poritiphilus flavus]|uniref:BspA family leucine-rich repeat surface protein n=1 Tax=Poritiphilus flavus TaxID=2697053 RepID=A0A6L9EHZ2_9FLAO|nr:BspA family leucine-rich repeat surface protein [Poritiphilus flavus]NAS14351.1 BspA family leucine-rich repeat surface protein [Poritiphilus flavus]